jgi:hypothetical protein
MSRLRVLLVTKIFPNAVHPDEAPYNRHQFAALSRYCDVQVLATIPWFPGAARLSSWPVGAGAPFEEVIDGLPVRHPRFLYVRRRGSPRARVAALACKEPAQRSLCLPFFLSCSPFGFFDFFDFDATFFGSSLPSAISSRSPRAFAR